MANESLHDWLRSPAASWSFGLLALFCFALAMSAGDGPAAVARGRDIVVPLLQKDAAIRGYQDDGAAFRGRRCSHALNLASLNGQQATQGRTVSGWACLDEPALGD